MSTQRTRHRSPAAPLPRRTARAGRCSAACSSRVSVGIDDGDASLPARSAGERARRGRRAATRRGRDRRGSRRALRGSPARRPIARCLGLAYQLRWRETGDAVASCRAPSARSARRSRPGRDDPTATLGLGYLALIRHEFRRRSSLGREAQKLAPHSAQPYGVVGDALVELGRYDEAFATFERMVALEAEPRLLRAHRLRPRADRATGGRDRRDAARARRSGRAARADRLDASRARQARVRRGAASTRPSGTTARRCTLVPGYVYALEQLARVEAARGRLDAAIAARAPGRGDDAAAAVRRRCSATCSSARAGVGEARASSATVAAIERLLVANGVRVDLESAVYRADHRIRPARDRRARAPGARRPALDLRRRRARLGARARRPLRRGACRGSQRALRLGHAGRAPLLPPRLRGRAAPATEPGMQAWYREGARAQPRTSRCAGLPSRAKARRVKRAALLLVDGVAAARGAARTRRLASAHPLGNFTVNHYAGIELAGRRRLRPLRARPGRDPDLPGRARACGGRATRRRSRAELELTRRRQARAARASSRTARRAPGRGRAEDAALRRRLPRPRRRDALSSPTVAYASRIGWREITVTARDGAQLVDELRAGARAARTSSAPIPQDLLRSPLDVRSARRRRTSPATARRSAPAIGVAAAPEHAAAGSRR